LLSCLLGLITPQKGDVIVAGRRLRPLSRKDRAAFRARNIGAVFQHGELVPTLAAEENVALPVLMSGQREEAIEKARSLLDALDVPATTRAQDLSGGEIQRAALARALIGDPLVVLADEPTGALDTDLRTKAADTLFSTLDERGCALVLVTLDPFVAARADHTFRLVQGDLLKD
jgi:lipoprotein-releasing system ATP-binding protein